MKHIRALISVMFVTMLLTIGFGSSHVAAQDASPAAADCAETTPAENVALIESYFDAVNAQDADTMDAILADNYTEDSNRFGEAVDDTTNADEISLAAKLQELYPGSTQTIDEAFGVKNRVVVLSTMTIPAQALTGEVVQLDSALKVNQIGVFTVECGEVTHGRIVVDGLTLLVGIGVLPAPSAAATPEA